MRLTPRMAEGVTMLHPRKAEGRAVLTPRMAEGEMRFTPRVAEGDAPHSTRGGGKEPGKWHGDESHESLGKGRLRAPLVCSMSPPLARQAACPAAQAGATTSEHLLQDAAAVLHRHDVPAARYCFRARRSQTYRWRLAS